MAAMQKILELKAANNVRRVVGKVRVATPENFEVLQNELFDCLEKELANLGDELHTKLQAECDTVIAQGQTRVAMLLVKRDEDEIKWKSHRDVMAELETLIEILQLRTQDLKQSSGLAEGTELTVDDVDAVEVNVKEMAEEVTSFTKSCAELITPKAVEMKMPDLPAEIKKSWGESAVKVNQAKQDALMTCTKARLAVAKALENRNKALLAEAKELFKDRVKGAAAPVLSAEEAVKQVETAVEPLLKNKATKERLLLCDEVEAAVLAAREIIAEAKKSTSPPTDEEGIDEKIRDEFAAWMAAEVKRPVLRLGQLGDRLRRVDNISRRFRGDISKVAAAKVIDDLKPKLLGQVKENAASQDERIKAVDQAIKDAEKAVETFYKCRTLSAAEMLALHAAADEVVKGGKQALADARHEICPIDESLDELVKKQLRTFIASTVRAPMLRVGGMERRLVRTENLVANYAKDIEKKKSLVLIKARLDMRRVLLHAKEAKSIDQEQLFALITKAKAVTKKEFLGFFAKSEYTTIKDENVELSPENLGKLFDSYCADGETSIPKAAFIEKVLTSYMIVVKGTLLTSGLSIKEGTKLRLLKVGEIVESLEGPIKEEDAGLMRIRARAVADNVEGWATVAGNAGTVLLKEHEGPGPVAAVAAVAEPAVSA